jgi:Flp pilus assembly protein TadB
MTYSELRASDAERERVVAFLREHALLGRLTSDELEERVGSAYAAVTVGDLERLIRDLPRPGHAPARRARPQRRPSPALIGVGAGALLLSVLPLAALAVVAAVALAAVAALFAVGVLLGPLVLVALLLLAVSRRRRPPRPRHRPVRWGPQY